MSYHVERKLQTVKRIIPYCRVTYLHLFAGWTLLTVNRPPWIVSDSHLISLRENERERERDTEREREIQIERENERERERYRLRGRMRERYR